MFLVFSENLTPRAQQKVVIKNMYCFQVTTAKDMQEILKDGVILCKLVNVIKPGSVKKINKGHMAFKQMENIDQRLRESWSQKGRSLSNCGFI